jgi:hypothetical protein
MVLQFFAPTCLLAAMRAFSVEMSAEESFSTSTTGRGSKKGCSYLPGAEFVLFRMVRPSANAAGEAKRKSAAAAPAALEESELRRFFVAKVDGTERNEDGVGEFSFG